MEIPFRLIPCDKSVWPSFASVIGYLHEYESLLYRPAQSYLHPLTNDAGVGKYRVWEKWESQYVCIAEDVYLSPWRYFQTSERRNSMRKQFSTQPESFLKRFPI